MINVNKLKELITATASEQGFGYVNADDGKPMVEQGLIIVNAQQPNPANAAEVAAKAQPAAQVYLDGLGPQTAQVNNGAAVGVGQIITAAFVAPAAKRRGNAPGAGAPSKYPFEQLTVGGQFFVGNSQVEKGDAFKTMSATVSSTNRRNSEETGETVSVERAKRGEDKKPILNPDGSKVMETITQKKRKALKHYKIVAVEAGKVYGEWTAPENGAVIIRDL